MEQEIDTNALGGNRKKLKQFTTLSLWIFMN
jgi:hypothetical protein